MTLARLINLYRHYIPAPAARDRRARQRLGAKAYAASRDRDRARAFGLLPHIRLSIARERGEA